MLPTRAANAAVSVFREEHLMAEPKEWCFNGIDRLISLAQLITLVSGLFILGIKVGARDQSLTEHGKAIDAIQQITADLARMQSASMAVDASSAAIRSSLAERLNDIDERLKNLERKP